MTLFTGCGHLGTAVAAETFSGIEPAVDAVPGQVIAPVGHATTRVVMTLEGGLEPRSRQVTIGAETGPMTDCADSLAAYGGQAVILPEQRGMLKPPVRKFMYFGIVALSTAAQVSLLRGMLQGQVFTLGPAGTGQHGDNEKGDADDDHRCASRDLGHGLPA
jgi:hypothetical protein